MFIVSIRSSVCPVHWSQVLSREWRYSRSRRCTNYIWVINKFVAYRSASYIRGLTYFIDRIRARKDQLIQYLYHILTYYHILLYHFRYLDWQAVIASGMSMVTPFNTSRPWRNDQHFRDDLFKLFSWTTFIVFWFNLDWDVLPIVQLIICQHRFGWWLGTIHIYTQKTPKDIKTKSPTPLGVSLSR